MKQFSIPLISTLLLALAAGGAQAQSQGVEEDFQAWRRNCPAPTEDTERPCVIYTQNGVVTDGGQQFGARMALGPTASQEIAIVIEVISAQQSEGFGLDIDGQQPLVATLPNCTEEMCRGSIMGELASDLIAQLRAGNQARVTYVGPDQQPVQIALSLMGFTAAYNSLTQ